MLTARKAGLKALIAEWQSSRKRYLRRHRAPICHPEHRKVSLNQGHCHAATNHIARSRSPTDLAHGEFLARWSDIEPVWGTCTKMQIQQRLRPHKIRGISIIHVHPGFLPVCVSRGGSDLARVPDFFSHLRRVDGHLTQPTEAQYKASGLFSQHHAGNLFRSPCQLNQCSHAGQSINVHRASVKALTKTPAGFGWLGHIAFPHRAQQSSHRCMQFYLE